MTTVPYYNSSAKQQLTEKEAKAFIRRQTKVKAKELDKYEILVATVDDINDVITDFYFLLKNIETNSLFSIDNSDSSWSPEKTSLESLMDAVTSDSVEVSDLDKATLKELVKNGFISKDEVKEILWKFFTES